MDCSPPGSSVHGVLQSGILKWVFISSLRDLPYPWIEPGSPALWADSLPSEPSGKAIISYIVNMKKLKATGLDDVAEVVLLSCGEPSWVP
jgi:hypothetical protein